MFDETNIQTNEAVAEILPDTLPEETEQVEQESPKLADQSKSEESAQAKNFRAIKEKAERLERERDEALRYANEVRSKYEKPQASVVQDEDDNFNINPDDIAEGKHIQKILARQKKLEEKISQYERQSTQSTTEAKIQARYPDFYKVVTQENLAQFAAMYPELARAIDSSSDLYSKAASAYELIKKYNISDEDTNQASKELIMKNLSKPRPAMSTNAQQGDSPLNRANAFANGLTPELKAALRKEMADAMSKSR